MEKTYWGIDMGGTKIEGVVLVREPEFKILERIRVPTEQSMGYDHVIGQFKKLVDLLVEKIGHRPKHIGVGTPGIIDTDTKLIKNSNTQCIIGKPMNIDLEKALNCKVTMANDANCFAIAEALLGVVPDIVKSPEVVFGVIMGTGVGSGVVVNGRVIQGKHGIGGEWGHNRLDETGDICYCGQTACVETFISGPSLERFYMKLTGVEMSLKDIYDLYLKDDPNAILVIDRLIYYFGKAVATVVNIIDPEIIVIGGGVGNLDVIYERGPAEVLKHLFNNELKTKFVKPKLGDSAGVIGAALL
jgi:predicted NBD/HSP70 family sugar kinase